MNFSFGNLFFSFLITGLSIQCTTLFASQNTEDELLHECYERRVKEVSNPNLEVEPELQGAKLPDTHVLYFKSNKNHKGPSQIYGRRNPTAPLIHPYNPEDGTRTNSGFMSVPLVIHIPAAEKENLPQPIQQKLKESGIGDEGLKIMLCAQNYPWNEGTQVCFRPHYAIETGATYLGYNRERRIRVGLLDSEKNKVSFAGIKPEEFFATGISTHPGGGGLTILSPNNMHIHGLSPEGQSFWTYVNYDKSTIATLHWVLSDEQCDILSNILEINFAGSDRAYEKLTRTFNDLKGIKAFTENEYISKLGKFMGLENASKAPPLSITDLYEDFRSKPIFDEQKPDLSDIVKVRYNGLLDPEQGIYDEYLICPTEGDGNCYFHAILTEPGDTYSVVKEKANDARGRLCDTINNGQYIEDCRHLVREQLREQGLEEDEVEGLLNNIDNEEIKQFMERFRANNGEQSFIPVRPGDMNCPAQILANLLDKRVNIFTYTAHSSAPSTPAEKQGQGHHLRLLKQAGIEGPIINILIQGNHYVRLYNPSEGTLSEMQALQIIRNASPEGKKD